MPQQNIVYAWYVIMDIITRAFFFGFFFFFNLYDFLQFLKSCWNSFIVLANQNFFHGCTSLSNRRTLSLSKLFWESDEMGLRWDQVLSWQEWGFVKLRSRKPRIIVSRWEHDPYRRFFIYLRCRGECLWWLFLVAKEGIKNLLPSGSLTHVGGFCI